MFLPSGRTIRDSIKGLLESELHEPARLAIAYWGRGAATMLQGPSKIVCNLASGACNPDEVRKMMSREIWDVRQHDDLHAKVVVTSTGAVVSSANFSSNGLGMEGAEASGLEEAGFKISVRSQEHLAAAVWFEKIWETSRPIEERDLIKAQQIWKQRNARSAPTGESHCDAAAPHATITVSVDTLLQRGISQGNRLRSSTVEVLNIVEKSLPSVSRQELGKIAMWACHLILLRAGHLLKYGPGKNGERGDATEDWIVNRIKFSVPKVKQAVAAIADDPDLELGAKHWAGEVLRAPPWEH